jgi:hypothetical protein
VPFQARSPHTDEGLDSAPSLTYRILESTDEHFYDQDFYFNFNYHWPMYGMGLSDDILKKVYRETALNAFKQARSKARGIAAAGVGGGLGRGTHSIITALRSRRSRKLGM